MEQPQAFWEGTGSHRGLENPPWPCRLVMKGKGTMKVDEKTLSRSTSRNVHGVISLLSLSPTTKGPHTVAGRSRLFHMGAEQGYRTAECWTREERLSRCVSEFWRRGGRQLAMTFKCLERDDRMDGIIDGSSSACIASYHIRHSRNQGLGTVYNFSKSSSTRHSEMQISKKQ